MTRPGHPAGPGLPGEADSGETHAVSRVGGALRLTGDPEKQECRSALGGRESFTGEAALTGREGVIQDQEVSHYK